MTTGKEKINLGEELRERGLLYQSSPEDISEIFNDSEKRTTYLGVDPTADSIHVGNLVTYIVAEHLKQAGHEVILLVGGATGLIGDPSGKDTEREFSDVDDVKKMANNLHNQLGNIKRLSKMDMVNNYDWFKDMPVLEFLRDVGKHFTVNSLIKKESVSRRLKSESGISFTEFSYALIQGYDYYHLNKEKGCDLQIGGSDQWGNIVSGIDLIRKKTGKTVYGFTIPLIVDKLTGKKFGKSEGNAVWLDPEKTSYYDFYQFWIHTDDSAVMDYLKAFTFLSMSEITLIEKELKEDAGSRKAQKKLAYEVTKFVHGDEIAFDAEKVSELIFSNTSLDELNDTDKDLVKKYATSIKVSNNSNIVDLLVDNGLTSSKREARELIQNKAIRVDGVVVDDQDKDIKANDFSSPIIMICIGKKNKVIVIFES